jgi:plasmid stability protein
MPRQVADQFVLRFPEGYREAIKIAAARNRRSMNAEILFHLEKVFGEAAREEVERARAA